MIATATRLTNDSGGPPQLDAEQFRLIILSKKFKKESKDLREQVVLLAKNLATTLVDPKSIEAFVACRLIALNKNPGVRPIGVGEILRRIIGKTIAWTLKDDIQEAASPLQTATGLKNGAEAAIHSMQEIFANEQTDAVILVDAKNAFNSLNRNVALHNIQITCSPFSTIMINTCRHSNRLIVFEAKDILSEEGKTQGDNLVMSFYALSLAPLLRRLRITTTSVRQVSLADNAIGAGKKDLKNWWHEVIEAGSRYVIT